MLSQFSWLQFFLFVGGAALLWYVYVLFVYFGSSINRAITQPREQMAIAIPVARRPVSRSIIQTEDFSIVAPPATTNQPLEQEPATALALKGEREGASEAEKEVATSVTASAPTPQSVLGDTSPAVNKDAAELLAALDGDDDIVTTEAVSDMSPAVLAALSGQSYNWADSPALNMDYREPDDKGIEEIIATPVTEETETSENTSENLSDTAGVPADDYATTIAQLVKPEVEPEARETVLASLQNLTGNTSVANLVQRSKNVAGNLSIAFEELQNRGQLSEAQIEFRERFLKPVVATTTTAAIAATVITEDAGSTEKDDNKDNSDNSSASNSSASVAVPATPLMDGEDYQALLDSMKV